METRSFGRVLSQLLKTVQKLSVFITFTPQEIRRSFAGLHSFYETFCTKRSNKLTVTIKSMCLPQTICAFILPIPENADFLPMSIELQLEVMQHFTNFCLKKKDFLNKIILPYHYLSKEVLFTSFVPYI